MKIPIPQEVPKIQRLFPRNQGQRQAKFFTIKIILKTLSLFFITFRIYNNIVYMSLHDDFSAIFTILFPSHSLPNRYTRLLSVPQIHQPPSCQTAISTRYFIILKQSPSSNSLNKSYKYSNLSSNITSRSFPHLIRLPRKGSQVFLLYGLKSTVSFKALFTYVIKCLIVFISYLIYSSYPFLISSVRMEIQ